MSNKIFDVVQVEKPNRNSFDLSFDYKTSFDMGPLVPVCVQECLPGDRFTIGSQALVRFAPMVAPTMQRYDCRIEYFFVPNRLLWENWMKFIASDPGDLGNLPAFPTVTINAGNWSPLCDYLGIPNPAQFSVGAASEVVNALPFAAYQLVYETYYRDQNLIGTNPNGIKVVDGDNTAQFANMNGLRNRAWEHDYFTSCLPFAQKGNPVTIGTTNYLDIPVLANTGTTGTRLDVTGVEVPGGLNNTFNAEYGSPDPGSTGIGARQLFADTSALDALSITINDLREAEALQKWLEINARAGTRPNEVIAGHFGVKSSDARLQRPEYIVGVKQPVSVSEVLNTTGELGSGPGAGSPQGTMAGHGVSMIDDNNYGNYFCEEHGFIIGLMSVLPKTAYMNGLSKFWLKTTDPTQYFFPAFAHLGEQPVENREVAAFQGPSGANTFGYLPAYQDYRFNTNMITGDFRSSLSYWHAGRIFATPPALNDEFITAVPREDIFAVTDADVSNLYVHVQNMIMCSRLVPVYGTPSLT